MVFPSYSVTALKEIVQQRIALCNESLGTSLSLFQPAAIELCCKKVVCEKSIFIILQAETGDARRLLDLCKTALQTVHDEGVIVKEKMVTISVMSRILGNMFRPNQQSIISNLPRMAQVLLACLCSMIQQKTVQTTKQIQVTPNTLKVVYLKVLKNLIGGTRPTLTEFQQLFDQLVHNGICKVVHSTKLKPLARPVRNIACFYPQILMIMKVEMICEELESDCDLTAIIKRGSEWISNS